MNLQRHEIPTHLNVEDKAFYGLSLRQAMYLTMGLAGSYGLWQGLPWTPPALRYGLAALGLLLAVALIFVRPYGRGLEEWIFIALRYAAVPKASVWRTREPNAAAWRSAGRPWEELAPRLVWPEERR